MVEPVSDREAVAEQLRGFILPKLPSAENVSVEVYARSGEGDSHENWLFDLRFRSGSERECWPLVLRRSGQSIATESDRRKEFAVLERLGRADLPVPEPLWLDGDGTHLGRPAFVMRRLPGRTDLGVLQANNVFGFSIEKRVAIGRELARLMARLHKLDWRACGLGDVLEAPTESPANARLNAVVLEIERFRLEPYPEIEEAVAWLEARLPKGRACVLTHGEFRSVQVLYDDQGRLRGMLDWEFARLSDPVDEVAYFLNPTAAPFHLIHGAWEEADFLKDYESASGVEVDPAELHWWKVLNMLWVLSFLIQAITGIVEERTDAMRTANFNRRLFGLLQGLLEQGREF